jgi:hypothetical protein
MEKQEFILEGMDEAIDALSELDAKTLLNVVRAVERKALNKQIIQPLRSAIPNVSLKSGVGITQERADKTAFRAGIKIGKRTGDEQPAGLLLLWIEAGTKVRITKKGWNRGQITPRNLLAPIISNNAESVITYFGENFAIEADKIVARKLKKINK